jgi:hypothetical protein
MQTGAQSVCGVFEEGEDLTVGRGQRSEAAGKVRCDLQNRLPGDLQSLQRLFDGRELGSELGDLSAESVREVTASRLADLELFQELLHAHAHSFMPVRGKRVGGGSRQVGVVVAVSLWVMTSVIDQRIQDAELAGRVS